jgi:type IV fimbrial biogenesis protein FimT
MFDRISARRGHSLPELLAMLGIVAILAGSAMPVFSNLLLDSRMNAAVATAIHAVNLARQFSATRSESILLCGTADERDCTGGTDWTAGLLLADDADAFRRNLALSGGRGGPRIRSNRAILSFEGGSGFATPATLTLCDRRGARAARAVIVSRSGRPRASARDASNRALKC